MADGYLDIKDYDTWFETGNHSSLQVTDDLELRFDVAMANWDRGTEQIIISKFGSGSQKAYEIHMGASDGKLTAQITPDGTQGSARILKAPGTMSSISVSANDRCQVRLTVDISGMTGQWYYRRTTAIVEGRNGLEDNTGWTTWGSAASASSISSIHSGTDKLTVMGGERATNWGTLGKAYAFRVYDGIGGTIVASPDFTDNTDGNWDSPPQTDSDGRSWTNRSGQTNPTDWDWIPPTNTKGRISWSELEVPDAARKGRVSWAELEVPSATGFKGRVSWAELEVPDDAGRRGRISWAELEVPDATELTWPDVIVELSPDDPLDTQPTSWVDVSAEVHDQSISRGRQHELARFEAGRATLRMKGRWGPEHPTYGSYVTLHRRFRIRLAPGGATGTQTIFDGYATSYQTRGHKRIETIIQLTDALGLLATMPMGSDYLQLVRTDDPIGLWSLEETVGDFKDSSASGNNGTPQNSGLMVRGSTSPFVGKRGYSLDFITTTQTDAPRVALASPPDIQGGAWTVETWVFLDSSRRSTAGSNDGVIFHLRESTDTYPILQINVPTYTDGLQLLYTADDLYSFIVTGPFPTVNTWHHLVVRYSLDGRLSFFLDGAETSGTWLGVKPLSTGVTAVSASIGGRDNAGTNSDRPWHGRLSHLAVYDYALEDARIRAHWASRLHGFNVNIVSNRLDTILVDRFGWKASPIEKQLDADTFLADDQLGNESVAAYLRRISSSTDGPIFVNRHGAIVAQDRHVRSGQSSLQTLSDNPGAGEIGYYDLTLSFDTSHYANRVNVQQESGRAFSSDDPAATDTEPEYAFNLGGVVVYNQQLVNDYADALLARLNSGDERIESITLRPGNDYDRWHCIATCDVGDMVTVERTQDGITFTQDVFIEHISHKGGLRGDWETRWRLSPANEQRYWVLGTGKLDNTTSAENARVGW